MWLGVAQLVARSVRDAEVVGSSPITQTRLNDLFRVIFWFKAGEAVVTESAVFDSGFSVVNEDVGTGRNELTVEKTTVQSRFSATVTDSF